MNFFEQELNKVMADSETLKDIKYVGRGCYGKLDDDIRARIEFTELMVHGKYDAVRVILINRKEGEIDRRIIRFDDLFGAKKVDNPNFRDGVVPHIWEYQGNYSWYVYKPTPDDYMAILEQIEAYLNMFL